VPCRGGFPRRVSIEVPRHLDDAHRRRRTTLDETPGVGHGFAAMHGARIADHCIAARFAWRPMATGR
jgi:hypothetical protein